MMPAQPPNDPRHLARLFAAMVPEEIAKSINNAEYNDRIVEAARLSAQANDPALSAPLRQAARVRARAVLQAQPRQVTRRQHAELVAKAAAARVPRQADAIRRHAERLIEELHPIAPSRGAAVRKAKADADDEQQPIAVFDADGNMVGICDPSDITPVAGKQATSSAPAAVAGEPVAKGQRLSVWDGSGRRYVTTRGKIRKTAQPRPGVYDDGPLYRVLDDTGYGTGVASPEVQALGRGPVNAGGTTGLGRPRQAGPAAALPGDGPQQARPGDVPGRQVVKALGPAWVDVHDYTGSLVGRVRRSDVRVMPAGRVLKGAAAESHANIYDSSRRLVGVAKLADITPLADLRAARRAGR